MTIRNELGFAWTGLLAGVLAATACGKVAGEHGGESHFQCTRDDDCHGADQVCVRANPSDETGECGPASEASETGGASAGGASAGGASGSGSASSSSGGVSGGSSNGGQATANGSIALGQCTTACCPTDESCYATAANAGSGRECAAFHDNTGQPRIQLRQTSTLAELPLALTVPIIQTTRSGYSQYPRIGQGSGPACFGQGAAGGGRFIQLLDIPLDGGPAAATSGFSQYVAPEVAETALLTGLCMVAGAFAGDEEYRLDAGQMSDSSDYPDGLPPPQALGESPWDVNPASFGRLEVDFNVATDRTALLADGVGHFFYDQSAGWYHSYAPIAYSVQHSAVPGGAPTIIPVREIETRLVFNDAAHPNCVGGIVPGESGCPAGPAWEGLDCDGAGNCNPITGVAGRHEGYMLITDLEQIFEPTLQTTLCVTVVTAGEAQAAGFLSADQKSCKGERWDPQAPNNEGLPRGDWCAATNSPATATCHDAFKIRERTAFAATKIAVPGAVPQNPPGTCPL